MQTYENLAPPPPGPQLHQLQVQLQHLQSSQHQLHQQQHPQSQTLQAPTGSTNMAAFLARLMSLNAQELQIVHSDCEIMKHLSETQLLVESRLHEINLRAKLGALHQQQQQQQQQQQYHQYALAAAAQQQQQHSGNGELEQTQLALYQDYYARAAQFAVVQQQQQQQMLLATVSHQHNQNPASSPRPKQQQPPHQQQLCAQQAQLALDLRTSSAGSISSTHEQQQILQPSNSSNGSGRRPASGHSKSFPNPKKIKLSEFQNQQRQQAASNQLRESTAINTLASAAASANQATPGTLVCKPKRSDKRRPQSQQQPHSPANTSGCTPPAPVKPKSSGGKKYKGEFDEPSPAEVEKRQKALSRQDHYHNRLGSQCACVLGSEFRDRPVSAVLEMIERWRAMDTDARIKSKWEIADLPKDIPLSEIKKFEELRREASNGRADFGGASKRKPLGIRGTRQFLMILYCLWGHPGRDDAMQREGYCPHCFARIKKDNEQSTLVRVVNHFNMKHRRGANPRLSPSRDHDTPPAATSPPAAISTNSKASKGKNTPTSTATTNFVETTTNSQSLKSMVSTQSPELTSTDRLTSTTTTNNTSSGSSSSSPEVATQQQQPLPDDNQSDSENNCKITATNNTKATSSGGLDLVATTRQEQPPVPRPVDDGSRSLDLLAEAATVSTPTPPVERSTISGGNIVETHDSADSSRGVCTADHNNKVTIENDVSQIKQEST